ncbi:MAG: cell division protein FtsL [Paracoccaceae bacterium]|nr:cell division protein FtsL [Paracoccaceae bacterium]
MRAFLSVLAALAVMGLAFWAYRENYATQAALDEVERLEREIGNAREALSVLRAEWAYLNRPDRLGDLAELNFDRLGLLPLRPEQFGSVDQVAFPPEPGLLPMSAEPVDVIGTEEPQE